MATTAAPRTPPQTPRHPKFKTSPRRNNLTSSSSPATSQSSPSVIYPIETISPPRPRRHRRSRSPSTTTSDGVHVEELGEGDVGYVGDTDVEHPAEFEDADSGSEQDSVIADGSSEREGFYRAASAPTVDGPGIEEFDNDDIDIDNDIEDEENAASGSDAGISRRFSRLGYNNPNREREEAKFHAERHLRHLRKRTECRVFKRSHSQSVKSETSASAASTTAATVAGVGVTAVQHADEAVIDPESMADHDNGGDCARRLRRRVRGPNWADSLVVDVGGGSSGSIAAAAGRVGVEDDRTPRLSTSTTPWADFGRRHPAPSIERRDRRLTPDGSEIDASDEDGDGDDGDHDETHAMNDDDDEDADVAMDLN